MIYQTLFPREIALTATPCLALQRRTAHVLLLLFALLSLSTVSVRADSVDDFMRRQIRKRHIPGLSLAIVRDGKIVKAAGYGLANVEVGARATPKTVYCLASMSKQFTAAAIMLLC